MGAAALSIVGLLCHAVFAQAAAAQPITRAVGYYRMHLGDFEITALSDGSVPLQTDKALTDVTRQNPAATAMNEYLVDTGSKRVGKLLGNLRAAGYQPEQIDEIYLTQLQPDHIGGLLSERKATFPNAIVRASREEADYWLAKTAMTTAPAEERQLFAAVRAALKPYAAAGRFNSFDAPSELLPGIRALSNSNRTPGRTVYTAESRGQKIVFGGDAPQFGAAHGDWVAGTHLSFPGIGHVRARGHGFEFVPATPRPADAPPQ